MYTHNRFYLLELPLPANVIPHGFKTGVWFTIKSIETAVGGQYKIHTGENGTPFLTVNHEYVKFETAVNPVCSRCQEEPIYGEIPVDWENNPRMCDFCIEEERVYKLYEEAFISFHDGRINLNHLTIRLLEINPFHPTEEEAEFSNHIKWVLDNVSGYLDGEHYLLSLTSSGSMLQSLKG